PVLVLEPAGGEVGAGRVVDQLADLAGDPDGGVCDPRGDAAHDEVARFLSDPRDRGGNGVADVANDRQLARTRNGEDPGEPPRPSRPCSSREASAAPSWPDRDRELALRLLRDAPGR